MASPGGVWSQMGMFGLGVHLGVGVAVGCGSGVGSGLGGTRGSGKPGSGTAARVCELRQSAPYGPEVAPAGTGVTITVAFEALESTALTSTRSPIRSPTAIAVKRTMTPAAKTIVAKRFVGSKG